MASHSNRSTVVPTDPTAERLWRRSQTEAVTQAGVTSTEVAAALSQGSFDAPWLVTPPGGWSGHRLGAAYELSLAATDRKARGAWFTPPAVVTAIVNCLWATVNGPPTSVLDPSCGGGAFLLGALDRFVVDGLDPGDALSRVNGLDIDPDAIAVARRALAMWAEHHGIAVAPAAATVADGLGSWPLSPQVVIGNPPFRSPLRSKVEPTPPEAGARADAGLGPYADLAAVFAATALGRVTGPEARVALVLPQSVLSSRDTGPLRQRCQLLDMWIDDGRPFEAAVHVAAPVLAASHPEADQVPWTSVAARSLGLPPSGIGTKRSAPAPTLADIGVTATAGFRDEYYGLAAACKEADGADPPQAKITTVGHLDPLVCRWGQRTVRIGGQKWDRPVVALEELDDRVRSWVAARLRPKVVVPTQGRVIEPVVDHLGRWVPLTPVISVEADEDSLNHIAALLLAPPVVAYAAEVSLGSALQPGSIKLSAKQLVALPTPADTGTWDAAASLVPQGPSALGEIAAAMTAAYGAGDDVLAWWVERCGPHGETLSNPLAPDR